MTQKTISLSTATAILIAYLWSQLLPNGPLFLLMSPNTATNIFLLAIALLAVRLTFLKRFRTVFGYLLTAAGAGLSVLIGGIGLASTAYNFNFLGWLGPIDFLLISELGIILAICALSCQHQPVKLKTRLAPIRPSLALPKPPVALPRLTWHSLRNFRSAS